MRLPAVLLCSAFLLTGCALQQTSSSTPQPAVKLTGSVHGGQQPISGAHVYLFAANTTGYGQPSVSLLNAASTGNSDSIGAYVLSDTNGIFSITNDYTCTPNTQVYLYTRGGNPGAGVNSAAGLLAALGTCPTSGSFLPSIPFINVNEVTTIAAANAFAGFATDATHVSSPNTPLALTGIANAFANATNLADISTGNARTITPAGNGAVPWRTINLLADILASCINSAGSGSTACSTLFSNSRSGGITGTQATDTATAAINIAHNPGGPSLPESNFQALLNLIPPDAPFQPYVFLSVPKDFTLALTFTGPTINQAGAIATDGSGNVWTLNTTASGAKVVSELSPSGAILSGVNGYVVGSDVHTFQQALAIDQNGNAWLTGTNHIYKVSSSGTVSTFQPDEGSSYRSIAIDGSGNVWTNSTSGTPALVELSPSGTDLHFTSTAPVGEQALAIDSSGIVWTTSATSNLLYGTSSATGVNVNVTEGDLFNPSFLSIDASGNPWVMGGGPPTYSTGGNYGTTVFSYNSSTSSYSPVSTVTGDLRESGFAIDGSGIAWVAVEYSSANVAAYSNSGSAINYVAGPYQIGMDLSGGIALDPSGDIWLTTGQLGTQSTVMEIIGTATPVVTPISVGVKNNTLATRP